MRCAHFICHVCVDEQRSVDAFKSAMSIEAARAEGYAEAVADVVAWLADEDRYARAEYLMMQIKDGAHVGAAKKGGV